MERLKNGVKRIKSIFETQERSQEYYHWKNEQYLQREKVLREHEIQEGMASRFIS